MDIITQESNKYRDPENVEQIINSLSEQKTLGDVKTIIDTYYPSWFVKLVSEYSSDYDYLNKNWKKVCEKIGCPQLKIILVSYLTFDNKHRLIQHFCELMTRAGFNIRRADEFGICTCGKAIPSLQLYVYMKSENLPVPVSWSSRCIECK